MFRSVVNLFELVDSEKLENRKRESRAAAVGRRSSIGRRTWLQPTPKGFRFFFFCVIVTLNSFSLEIKKANRSQNEDPCLQEKGKLLSMVTSSLLSPVAKHYY